MTDDLKKSELERAFETYWRQLDGPHLEHEYQFDPTRKWRFDFASRGAMIAIELEGGTWTNGRHIRPAGFALDCLKYNTAALQGWIVFRFTADMLHSDPVGHLLPIASLIERRLKVQPTVKYGHPNPTD